MLTKTQLRDEVAETYDITKSKADSIINLIFGAIAGTLKSDMRVRINGFGTFTPQHRPERKGVNPRTKERITIKAYKHIKFTSSKALKDYVNHVTP